MTVSFSDTFANPQNGVTVSTPFSIYVPGTFELPLGAQYLCEYHDLDGVIAIGTVIQGETKHFDYVCEGATKGLMDVTAAIIKPTNLTYSKVNYSKDTLFFRYMPV